MTTKTKPVQLTAADEAAIFAWPRLTRQIDSFQESRKYLVPEDLIDQSAEALCLLADPYSPWQPARWALLVALDTFCRDTERDPAAWSGRVWRPATLSATSLGRLRQIGIHVGEFKNPPPEPQPERRPLESLDQLHKQNVSVPQICTIFGWVDERGLPDHQKYHAACRGEIEVPTFRLVMPASNRPKTRPHPGRFEAWCADQLEFFSTTHAQLVEKYLDKRDSEATSRRRRSEAIMEDDHEDVASVADDVPADDHDTPAAEPRRGRGRPRKALAPSLAQQR
mgnify:FL=1